MDPRDGDCITRCLDGHPNEYRFLVERYQGVLVSWLTGRLGNRLSAEEAVQEAFVRAWLALGRFRTGEPFFPWIAAIAVRVARETARAERRRDRRLRLVAEAGAGSATSTAVGADEPDLALRRAVDALPETDRSVVLLRYYGQCSCREVAERLGLPLGTVTKMLSRAHARLRDLLRRRGEDAGRTDRETSR
jgi:RNA polymerase sigma factor (sigma-70 family)